MAKLRAIWSRVSWTHLAFFACSMGAAVCSAVVQEPWLKHSTVTALTVASVVLGAMSKSLRAEATA